MKNKLFNKINNGFTLMEVVFAIGLTVTGLLSVSALMLQNIQAGSVDQKILVSSMLAQEGLELVRNQRDLNWLTGGAEWDDRINDDANYAIDYYPLSDTEISIDYTANTIGDDPSRLMIDDYGFYAHSIAGGRDTEYYRLIEVDNSNMPSYLVLKCTVRFERLGKLFDYIASTHIYSWRY